ncbi:MAG: ATP-binding protein [Granulosicoccus sp.]
MTRLILVCGSTGAGKTTYSLTLAQAIKAVRFSIDPWMQTLFSKDMKSLDYEWMIERVYRCYEQIWEVGKQILVLRGNVILDLGFTTKEQRGFFITKAKEMDVIPEVHYLDVPVDVRKQRVRQRNISKDPDLYAFEVTEFMFDFMEPRFEIPSPGELANGCTINA